MRVYIIGNDGITLCRKAPATVTDGEIAVASNEDLHAAPLSAKRLLALWRLSNMPKATVTLSREQKVRVILAELSEMASRGVGQFYRLDSHNKSSMVAARCATLPHNAN